MPIIKSLLTLILLSGAVLVNAQNNATIDNLLKVIEEEKLHFDWESVSEHCIKLSALLEGSDDYESLIKLHSNFGDVYLNFGDAVKFSSHLNEALSIIEKHFDGHHLLKYEIFHTLIKVTSFFDFPTAEILLAEFKVHLEQHPNEIAYANYQRLEGINRAMKQQFYSAIDYFEKSFLIGGFYSSEEEAAAYQSVAHFYSETKQKEKAFSYLVKGANLLEKEKVINYTQLSAMYQALARVHNRQLTKVEFERKVALAEKAKQFGYKANKVNFILRPMIAVVHINLLMNRYFGPDDSYLEKALAVNDSILILQKNIESENGFLQYNYARISECLITDLMLEDENKEAARKHINQILSLDKRHEFAKGEEVDEWYLARLRILEGRPLEAIKYIQTLMCNAAPNWDCTLDFKDNPTLEDCSEILFNENFLLEKSRALFIVYKKNQERQYLHAAKEAFMLWDQVVDHKGKYERVLGLWVEPYREVGYEIFNALYQLNQEPDHLTNALFYAEKQKNYAFISNLGKVDDYFKANIPDSIKLKEGILKEEMGILESKVNLDTTSENGQLEETILVFNQKKKEYYDFVIQRKEKFPQDTSFIKSMSNFKVDQFEEIITADRRENLIEFVLSKENLYAIVVADKKSTIIQLDGTVKELRALIQTYQTKLRQHVNEFEGEAMEIYRRIFLPIIPYLTTKELIIIVDKELTYLPIELLMDREGHFVIETYDVRYVYSMIWTQYEEGKSRGLNNGEVLAMAASPEMKTFASLYEDVGRGDLAYLPGALAEVNQLKSLLKGQVVVENKATESFFKENAKHYSILHLAAHAIIDEATPSFSKLVFSQEDQGQQDAYLNAYEISNMQLNADLVTLSACNSGNGRIQEGEGVQSLATAFVYAGCPNSVSSLWTVDDKSSAIIMKDFYQNLLKGLPIHKAIRAAKLSFFQAQPKSKKHPYYWGGFVYYGNDSTIALVTKKKWYANYWFFGLLGLAAFFLWQRKRISN